MKTLTISGFTLMIALTCNAAWAQVEINTRAEIETVEVMPDGTEVARRVDATRVVPGTEVIYTITATNSGQQAAEQIVVTNPVPAQTQYVAGSAAGNNTAIAFSVDGGDNWGAPEALTVTTATGETRAATAGDYTHVRWTLLDKLVPGQAAPVSYRVQVK